MAQILAFDYGTTHIGVAQEIGGLAEPLTTITLDEVDSTLAIHHPHTLIIGAGDSKFAASLENFHTKLQTNFPEIKVVVVDESFTSHRATSALLHTSQKRRHEKVHEVAAAIILQDWLDSHSDNS